jgi:hypothetical protein
MSLSGTLDGAHFFGDIDPHRTPSDATATADTAASPELIVPGRQFVGHPLSVTRTGGRPDDAARDIRKVHCEARIPTLPTLSVVTGQIRGIFDCRTETSRARHGAIGTGQAAVSHIRPTWVLWILNQELAKVLRLHRPAHGLGCFGDALIA